MSTFDRQEDKAIRSWSKWQWNPITGCHYDCSYCHAVEQFKKLYGRTKNEAYESFLPRLWPERFDAPYKTQIPQTNAAGNRNVLVGHQGDIFGDWVDREHLEAVLEIVHETQQWNYIFLTKNAKRYLEFELPDNCWIGVKIDSQQEIRPALEVFNRIHAPVRFVSCDPLVTWLRFPTLECFDWLVIGGRPKTKNRPAFNPPKMWITGLTKQALSNSCKIFVKHLKTPSLRQYPGAERNG